jgi:hypothetical protein
VRFGRAVHDGIGFGGQAKYSRIHRPDGAGGGGGDEGGRPGARGFRLRGGFIARRLSCSPRRVAVLCDGGVGCRGGYVRAMRRSALEPASAWNAPR